jgi:hypothetical protein
MPRLAFYLHSQLHSGSSLAVARTATICSYQQSSRQQSVRTAVTTSSSDSRVLHGQGT